MKDKKRILVDISYGMSFRNIVLNKSFWNYLTSEYQVDIVTPLNLNLADIKNLGISNIYNISHQELGLVRRLLLKINYKALHIKRFIDLSDFFLRQHHGWPLVSRFHQSMQDKDNLTIDLFFWPAIKRTFLGKYIRRLVNLFPILHPIDSILRKNKYEFLINTHTSEYASVLNSQVANKRDIPIISFPMGLDNIMHGPILFKPTKILFWGADQEFEFNKFQINWNNEMSKIHQGVLGSLIFDSLRKKSDSVDISSLYDFNQSDGFLLFCTMVEYNHPGQVEICEDIINFLSLKHLNHRLIIRLRPGFDKEMWTSFKFSHPDRVILQTPSGVSFDKSSVRNNIDIKEELEDISVYASTINQSSLVISRAHSTTYTDALYLGTPSVLSQYYPLNKKRSKGFQEMWDQVCTVYPHHKRGYNFAFNQEQLIEYLDLVLTKEKNNIKEIESDQKALLEKQLNLSSITIGELAVEEIKNFEILIKKNIKKND
jgi:hypothetical protein